MGSKKDLIILASFLFILIFLPSVLAADLNFGARDIAPPEIPNSEIQQDKESEMVYLYLEDWNNQKIDHIHLNIYLKTDQYTKKTLMYVEKNYIELSLKPGLYEVILKGDSLETPGGDYYYEGLIDIAEGTNTTLKFLPVGSVRGVVQYNDELVENAMLKFECGKNYGDLQNILSDEFGSFSNDYLPVGNCQIYARNNGRVGFVDNVQISSGNITSVIVNLNKKTLQELNIFVFALILVVTLIIILVFYKTQSRIAKKTAKKQNQNHNKRAEDLLKTFNSKEQKIVKLLMDKGELYQNRIVYDTGIPKTSLTRILLGLEQKKAVQITKYGKTKKVKLSNWFLNKEK